MAWEQGDKVVGSPQTQENKLNFPNPALHRFPKGFQQDTLAPVHYHTGLVLLQAEPAWGCAVAVQSCILGFSSGQIRLGLTVYN